MAHVQFDTSQKIFDGDHTDFFNLGLYFIQAIEKKLALKGVSCKLLVIPSEIPGNMGVGKIEVFWNGRRFIEFKNEDDLYLTVAHRDDDQKMDETKWFYENFKLPKIEIWLILLIKQWVEADIEPQTKFIKKIDRILLESDEA